MATYAKGDGKHFCRNSEFGGMEWSYDGQQTWYFTFRSLDEIRSMWGELTLISSDATEIKDDTAEREVFGETLDEEIPDDLWNLITG